MASTSPSSIADLRQQFETVLAQVTDLGRPASSAAAMEQQVLEALLRLGRDLLAVYFTTQAAARPPAPALPDGTCLTSLGRRPRRYVSIFGALTLSRHAFQAPGQPLVYPLDRALALPASCYSALLAEWACLGATDAAYREVQTLLERILGQRLSVQALERMLAQGAGDVAAFDAHPAAVAQPVAPQPDPAPLVVVQADGKGVPLVLAAHHQRAVRPHSGRPGGRMKEAIVTAHYTITPWVRTPAALVAALLDGTSAPAGGPRPQPQGKQLRASLGGKTAAIADLAARVSRRALPAAGVTVALCDGAEAIQDELRRVFPQAMLVLDIIHASEYLWSAATAIVGERAPARLPWMRQQLTALLSGQVGQVIATLEAAQVAPGRSAAAQTAIHKTLRYYRRNQPYMHYDQYLAVGWPIGTGVVEGACGHLVKDRLQQAGMRWTIAGAQAMLDLRAVRLSGEWEDYWSFHRRREQHRLYGAAAPAVQQVAA